MAWYHISLLSAAAVAILAAWNVPRAAIWVSLGVVLYVASACWHNSSLPYGAAFGAATNFLMLGLLFVYGNQKWEIWLAGFFNLMLLVDALYMFGVIRDKFVFAASLELINLAALVFIIWTGALQRGSVPRPSDAGRVAGVHHALLGERAAWTRPWK